MPSFLARSSILLTRGPLGLGLAVLGLLCGCGAAAPPEPKVSTLSPVDATSSSEDASALDQGQSADAAEGTNEDAAPDNDAIDPVDTTTSDAQSCLQPGDCPGGSSLCIAGKCMVNLPCQSDKQCTEAGLVCDPGQGLCVPCVSAQDCPPDQVCTKNACKPPAKPCATSKDCPKQLVCDKVALVCVECVSTTDCTSPAVCLDHSCLPPVCAPGSQQCATLSVVQTCRADASGWQVEACVGDTACADGTCKPVICTPNEPWCQGDEVRICDASGTQSSLSVDCLAISSQKMTCEGGKCVEKTCTPGQTLCVDAATQATCKAGSGFFQNTPCSAGQACEGAACKPVICPPAKPYCAAAKLLQCSPLGTASQLVSDCGAKQQFCATGACTATPPLCAAGAQQCIGASLQICSPDASAWTTASCDDGNPCTDDACIGSACQHTANALPCGPAGSCGTCKGGVCVAGASPGLDLTLDTGVFEQFNDVVQDGGGNLIGAGWHITPATSTVPEVQSGWLVKRSPQGVAIWSLIFPEGQYFRGVGPASGGWLAWGRSDKATPWFVRTDTDGNALWSKNFDCPDCNLSSNAGVVSSNATFVCGASGSGSTAAYCLCVDPDGGKLWQQNYPEFSSFQGMTLLSDGHLVTVGDTKKGSQADADFAILRLTPSGTVVWKQVIAKSGADVGLAVVAVSDGVVALARLNGDSKNLVLMKYALDGKPVWSQSWLIPQVVPCGVSRLLPGGDDGVLLVGTAGTYETGSMKACLQRVDAAGGLSWSRIYKNPNSMLLGGTNIFSCYLLAGATNFYNSPLSDGLLLKATSTGMLGCACAQDLECDDKNPCTLDACNAGLCLNDPTKAGAPCSGGTCDGNGSCAP